MLRPPKAQGVETWFDRASELRTQATALGQAIAVKDLAKSRNLLTQVAGSCNRCHQNFRVPIQIDVTFPKEPMQKVQKVSLSHP